MRVGIWGGRDQDGWVGEKGSNASVIEKNNTFCGLYRLVGKSNHHD